MSADDFTTTISTMATANATIAQTNAQLAQDAADRAVCMVQMQGYQNDKATPEAARAYASCVRLVYGTGQQLPHNVLVALKLLVVICIVGTIFGAWNLYRKEKEASMAILGALIGLLVSALVFGLGGLAIWFLFS